MMWKYTCSDFLCVEILVKFLICYKTKVQGVSSNWKSKDQIDIHIKIQGWYCKSTQNLYVLYSLRGFVAGWKRVGGEGRGEHINKKREKKEKGREGGVGACWGNPFKPSIFNPHKGACFGGVGEAWCRLLLYDFVLWLFNDFALVSYFFLLVSYTQWVLNPKSHLPPILVGGGSAIWSRAYWSFFMFTF